MVINETIQGLITGTAIGGLIMGMIFIFLLIWLGLWIYTSLAYSTIGKKLKYKNHWLAWIPFARTAMILELGKFNWALVFLLLVPVLGWIAISVLCIIARWRIFEDRNYPGWLALIPLAAIIPLFGWLAGLAFLIILGLVAWQDQKKKK